jgi:hypothetical protein
MSAYQGGHNERYSVFAACSGNICSRRHPAIRSSHSGTTNYYRKDSNPNLGELGCLRCRDYPCLAWICSISQLIGFERLLLRCICPLLAQSGHPACTVECLLWGGKADMRRTPLSLSLPLVDDGPQCCGGDSSCNEPRAPACTCQEVTHCYSPLHLLRSQYPSSSLIRLRFRIA